MTNLAIQMFTSLQKNVDKIEKVLGYTFSNKDLLTQAFVDSSFPLTAMVMEDGETNEDFMWRGNYLLQLAIADSIEANHHTVSKSGKNMMLIKHISSEACVKYLDKLNIFNYYLYSMPHSLALNPDEKNKPFKAKCFKSLLTAIYLDSGKDFSKISDLFIDRFSDELEDSLSLSERNWKGLLNEWAQKSHIPQPLFTVVDRHGADHTPIFKVQVTVNGDNVGEGTSCSKKEAEQIAAKIAYGKLVKN
jgi:ribonuclease-3